jgi:methyltransferase
MRILSLLALAFVPMAIEAARAARNERVQLARGGIEPPGDVYNLMRIVYPLAFLAMIAESVLEGAPTRSVAWTGAAVFTAAKALKWWAISTLGPFWTFRVVVVPGVPLVDRGPYRWLRHPNYVAVMAEFAGIALLAGAPVAGVSAMAIFGRLLVKRISVEEQALEAAREHPRTS